MAAPTYVYKIADWKSGVFLGELPLTAVTFSSMLQPYGVGTWQASLPLGDARMQNLDPIFNTEPSAVELVIERTSGVAGSQAQVVFAGPLLSRSYSSKTQSLVIGGRESWAYFDRRLIEDDSNYVAIDQGLILQDLLTRAALKPEGDMRFDLPTAAQLTSGVPRTTAYLAADCKAISAAIEELAALSLGFEFFTLPYWSIVAGLATMRHALQFGSPQAGSRTSPAKWEVPGVVSDYSWDENGALIANEIFGIGDDGTGKVRVSRSKLLPGRYPLLQSPASFRTLTSLPILQAAALAAVQVASVSVINALIAVVGDQRPEFGSYGLGDNVAYQFTDPRFAGVTTLWRLSGWAVTAPDAGTGTGESVSHFLVST